MSELVRQLPVHQPVRGRAQLVLERVPARGRESELVLEAPERVRVPALGLERAQGSEPVRALEPGLVQVQA